MATSNQSSQKKKKYARLRILGVFLFVLSILAAPLNLIVGAVLGFSGIWMTTYYRTFMEESQGHTPTPCFKRIFPVLATALLALWISVGFTVTSDSNKQADVSTVSTIENSPSSEQEAAGETEQKKKEAEKNADDAKAKQEAEKKAADDTKAKQEVEKKAAADAVKAKQEAEKKAAASQAASAANRTPPPAPNPDGRTIYITPTGKRYHYDSKCNGGTYIESTLAEAKERGLTPCSKCVA